LNHLRRTLVGVGTKSRQNDLEKSREDIQMLLKLRALASVMTGGGAETTGISARSLKSSDDGGAEIICSSVIVKSVQSLYSSRSGIGDTKTGGTQREVPSLEGATFKKLEAAILVAEASEQGPKLGHTELLGKLLGLVMSVGLLNKETTKKRDAGVLVMEPIAEAVESIPIRVESAA
jgi:hypothetical protein